MVEVGNPKYQYQIPYDENWYIIITSNNHHFYFNKTNKKSYWQLHDVFQDNSEINVESFLNSINYNYISLLIGLNSGLNELKGFHQKLTGRQKSNKAENVIAATEQNVEVEEIESEKSDSEYEVDEEAKRDFISNLLKEEGYLPEANEQVEEIGHQSSQEQKNVSTATGLVSGYSSDEADSDDDTSHKVEEESHSNVLSTSPQSNISQLDSELESDNGDLNQELDLSLSDDELTISNITDLDKDTKRNEFLSLLDKFEERISIFDTWELVEEELIQELVKNPEFFSITEPAEREKLFTEWCKSKSENTENNDNINFSGLQRLLYLKYLQNHKADIKSTFYQQFLEKNFEAISEIDLPPKQKEKIYLSFKIMINDFAKFEKKTKKSKLHDSNINLKKKKLDDFLKAQFPSIDNSIYEAVDIEKIEKLDQDFFEKWLALINAFNIPLSITENVENFIVGDEKRFQSYIEAIRRALAL